MSSATKTLALLEFFSPERPSIGLSQLCRLAKRDKATTYRHLQALEDAGFVEQNDQTRQYRLGPALLKLAQVRELTVPRKLGAQSALEGLSKAIGETAHVTVLSGSKVYPLVDRESQRHSTRAIVDLATFPLHATASGLCALAFGPDHLFDYAIDRMEAYTPTTVVSPVALKASIDRVRALGFAHSNRGFERDVEGISAPLFGPGGQYAGAVSVACVATRFSDEIGHAIQDKLILASREITHNWGGFVPANIEALWAKTLSHSNSLEATS